VTWEVAVAGTFHRDDVTTPAGRRDVLGGSAVYFALAASRFAPVHVNGIVGADTAAGFRAMLDSPAIHLDGMFVSDLPTFRWHAVHDFERWVTSRESAEPGCDPEWRPLLPARSRPAEIALVDLDLPPAGGVTAVRRLAAEYPALRTIVWSLQPPGEVVLAAIRAGASGFLHKEVSPDGLLRALRGITQGEAPLSRNLAGVVIEALHGHDDRARARELAARALGPRASGPDDGRSRSAKSGNRRASDDLRSSR